jgi:hypothetical protein
LQFDRPEQGWFELTKKIKATERPYLFYDAFDWPEYVWLGWRGIGQATMERLLCRTFEKADFAKSVRSSAPDLDPPGAYCGHFPASFREVRNLGIAEFARCGGLRSQHQFAAKHETVHPTT